MLQHDESSRVEKKEVSSEFAANGWLPRRRVRQEFADYARLRAWRSMVGSKRLSAGRPLLQTVAQFRKYPVHGLIALQGNPPLRLQFMVTTIIHPTKDFSGQTNSEVPRTATEQWHAS